MLCESPFCRSPSAADFTNSLTDHPEAVAIQVKRTRAPRRPLDMRISRSLDKFPVVLPSRYAANEKMIIPALLAVDH